MLTVVLVNLNCFRSDSRSLVYWCLISRQALYTNGGSVEYLDALSTPVSKAEPSVGCNVNAFVVQQRAARCHPDQCVVKGTGSLIDTFHMEALCVCVCGERVPKVTHIEGACRCGFFWCGTRQYKLRF